MQIFVVGGAVRDFLLGRPSSDRDYVVVGATPEAMIAQGFKPVGKDFPVFLHPETKAEYALARTERKTAPGYHGFHFHAAPDVTLEQDLARRDLTINAMAHPADIEFSADNVIDPYGGKQDLVNKVFRHVSPAFAEDPVRILRLARFAARYPEFTVAPETMNLMRQMVEAGEVDALVAERVWQELSRGLMEEKPSRMLEVLRDCDALARLLPEVDALYGVPQRADHHPEIDTGIHTGMVVDMAAKLGHSLPVRFACLVHDLGKALTPPDILPSHHGHEARGLAPCKQLNERLRVPKECAELARLMVELHGLIHSLGSERKEKLTPETILSVLERTDAFRRPERFAKLLEACECDSLARPPVTGLRTAKYEQWKTLLCSVRSVSYQSIASLATSTREIPTVMRQKQLEAVELDLTKQAALCFQRVN